MKRFIALILVLTLLLSISVGVAYADPKGKAVGHGKERPVKEKTTGNDKKAFKQELNDEKREVQGEISELEAELEALLGLTEMVEGEESEGEPVEGSEAAVSDEARIQEIEKELAQLKVQKKEIINKRYMVVKSEYTPEELADFESAASMIEDMYANALGLGSVTVRDNIIKFDTPPYIKGGRTVVPVRAITEELGADVLWDEASQTVTISMDGSSTTGCAIVLGINSRTVTVNGELQTLDVEAEITNGRTYVPLRFVAETFGLEVDWDAETETIDIVEEEAAESKEATEEEEASSEEELGEGEGQEEAGEPDDDGESAEAGDDTAEGTAAE